MMGKRINVGICALFVFVIFSLPVAAGAAPPANEDAQQVAAETAPQPASDSDSVVLEKVVVEETAPEGSAAAGYLVKDVNYVGPWRDMKLQDAPYSIQVISSDLLDNSITGGTMDQIVRMIPNAAPMGFSTYNNNLPGVSMRGFGAATMVDGIRMSGNNYGIFVDDLERIEIISGFTSFLYGGGYAGGTINYISKRPTEKYVNSITAGNFGGKQYYIKGDFGGPVPFLNGKLGYRFNVAHTDGETAWETLYLKQTTVSLALDWKIMAGMVLEVNAGYRDYDKDGHPGTFQMNWATSEVPSLKGLRNDLAYGQPWANQHFETWKIGAKLKWEINKIFDVVAGFGHENTKSDDTLGTDINPYSQPWSVNASRFAREYHQWGGYAYGNAKFSTWFVDHKITGGYSSSYNKYRFTNRIYGSSSVGATIEHPHVPYPTWTSVNLSPYGTASHYTNVQLGDEISLGDKLTFLLGGNYVSIKTDSYHDQKITPNISVVYKPWSMVSIYGTWIQALETSQMVPFTTPRYRNEGEILSPTTSDQYEIGVKTTLGGALFTGALYYIDKANNYDQYHSDGTRTFTRDGRQVHQGVEFTATGKLFDCWTLFGGVTWLDAEITKTTNAAQKGKTPGNVPGFIAKLYTEYDIPFSFLEGLTLTGGAYHTGKQYVNNTSSNTIPSFTIFDLGARYAMDIFRVRTIFRLNVQNVADKKYWARSSYPAMGMPRTVTFSVTTSF